MSYIVQQSKYGEKIAEWSADKMLRTNSLNSKILKILICGCLIWLSASLGKPQIVLSQAQRPPIALSNVSRVAEIARFGRGRVSGFSWTPDDQLRAITSAGIWQYNKEQLKTDQPTSLLKDYSGEIVAVAGNSVFLRQRDKSLTLYDLQTRQERRILEPSYEHAIYVAVTADGTKLAYVRWSAFLPAEFVSKDDFAIHIWNIQSGKEIQALKAGRVFEFHFSPNGKLLGTLSNNNLGGFLWDVQTGSLLQTLLPAKYGLIGFAFSNDSAMLALGDVDGTIQLIETQSGKLVRSFPARTEYSAATLAFNYDGQFITSANWRENIITVWKIATGEVVATLKEHQSGILALSFSPDGTSLVSSSYDEKVRIWDVKTWSTAAVLSSFTNPLRAIVFNTSNSQLVFASYNIMRTWDPVDTTMLRATATNPTSIEPLTITPDGKTLFTSGYDGLQEWESGKLNPLSEFKAQSKRTLAVSPNGTLLAAASFDQAIELWDIDKKLVVRTLAGHKDAINKLAFSPDGAILISVSGATYGDIVGPDDNTLRLWDVQTGKPLAVLQGVANLRSLAISSDGKLIATGASNGVIQLWDVASKSEVARFSANTDTISSLVFSKDNSLLFAGGSDSLIHVWDVKVKTEVYKLKGHTNRINDLVLNSDGTLLASASDEGTVRVWAVN